MRFKELLQEYNEQKLINDFGNKLTQRYQKETKETESAQEILAKITSIDPTPNKEFTFWCAMNYANTDNPKFNGGITRFEDIGRAMDSLEKFKRLLRNKNLTPALPVRDVNQIRGLTTLEDIVTKYPEKEMESNKEKTSAEEQGFYQTNQAQLIYNDPQVKVVVPKTEKASCFFGINTQWCTAAKNNNMFNAYSKEGPLYIVLLKKENKRYQFHFQNMQFMDEKDKEINPNELADKYPILWDIFTPIAEKNKTLALYKNPSEAVQLAAVRQTGYAIEYIENPSEAVQLAAVQKNGWALRDIENPSEAVQLAAVQQTGYAIQHIENPSEAVQLAAVQQNGWALQHIENPSEAVQLAAVKQDGDVIQLIKRPSKAVQLAAGRKK